MTEAECKLWHQVRDRRLSNAKFRKQVTIHPFVVDFLCIEKRLVVEVDGCQHTPEADASRTAFLQSKGHKQPSVPSMVNILAQSFLVTT
jgi:very-short-patch-repair endonuclease